MAHRVPQICLASGIAPTTGSLAAKVVQSSRDGTAADSIIDRAFGGLVKVTQLTALATKEWHVQHGLILSASAVAVAEDYVRSLLTEVVQLCPLTERRVGSLSTRLEFVF